MQARQKLRVVTPQTVGALALVRAEIAAVVGEVPRPELQELEGRDVVVELELLAGDGLPATPSEVARAVSRQASSFDVLSAWREAPRPPAVARPPQAVLSLREAVESPVALRALLDDVATAAWRPAEATWDLGVPCTAIDGHREVGYCQRRGYSRRFSTLDVQAARAGMAGGSLKRPEPGPGSRRSPG